MDVAVACRLHLGAPHPGSTSRASDFQHEKSFPPHFRSASTSGNETPDITSLTPTVRPECGPRHFDPTVAKRRDRGVFSCAGGETGPLIPRFSKGLRRWLGVKRLSSEVARDTVYSHAWPSGGPILAQTLGRLSVSRGLG